MIEWKKRAKKDQTDISDRRIWESWCGKYRVVESQVRFGDEPKRYYAMLYKTSGPYPFWDIISKHRKKDPATKSCEQHEKEHGDDEKSVDE